MGEYRERDYNGYIASVVVSSLTNAEFHIAEGLRRNRKNRENDAMNLCISQYFFLLMRSKSGKVWSVEMLAQYLFVVVTGSCPPNPLIVQRNVLTFPQSENTDMLSSPSIFGTWYILAGVPLKPIM